MVVQQLLFLATLLAHRTRTQSGTLFGRRQRSMQLAIAGF